MNASSKNAPSGGNSILVMFGFCATLLFQTTALKHIWNIEIISRYINAIAIVVFSGYVFFSLPTANLDNRVIKYYLIPGAIIYIGDLINITRSAASNVGVINQYGLVIPWAIYLAVPIMVKHGMINVASLWRYYYYFMLGAVSLGIGEYYLLFNGLLDGRTILTSGGYFYSGFFSILYSPGGDELDHRLYAAFFEPGTLAMFLLPAMAYACFSRKIIALFVFAVAMYMTDSLGGFFGLAMLVPLVMCFSLGRGFAIPTLSLILSATLIFAYFGNNLLERYQEKGLSATVREENAWAAVKKLPILVFTQPLGLPITTSTAEDQENSAYTGRTFAPANAFDFGGVLALLGYIAVLAVSLWYAILSLFASVFSREERAAIVSICVLFPFIVQRMVIWDYSLFSLLFAPFVIRFLVATNKMKKVPVSFAAVRIDSARKLQTLWPDRL